MAFPVFCFGCLNIDLVWGFFNFENKAPGFISKCVGFISKWVVVQLRVHQGSFDAPSNEPYCTLNWTTTHFEMNPDALWNEPRGLIFKVEKNPKNLCFKKPKTKTGKAINPKIYLLVYGQKLIFNLGIPLTDNFV